MSIHDLIPLRGTCRRCGDPAVDGGRWCRACMDAVLGPGLPAMTGARTQPYLGTRPIVHGTPRAVAAHNRAGETACETCRRGLAEHRRSRSEAA